MLAIIILGVAAMLAAALLYGRRRRETSTSEMHARLDAERRAAGRNVYRSDDLTGLPAPVQRYFRRVLKDGQPMVSAVHAELSGTINMSTTGQSWKRFTSTQLVVTERPGFDWEGRIEMMPGLTANVHDAYIAGEGILHAAVFGLVTLASLRGTPEMAHGELMRFLAEAVWYPTALLPGQSLQWTAVDDFSATATLKDGETSLPLLFRFDEEGLIRSVRAEARGRAIGGAVIPTPWEGQWSDYEVRDGMLIPMEGEVAWVLPEGPWPYFRGRITSITYELAPASEPAGI